jgi:peptidoglycan/LPS O-acetylase OafA/YrhL
LLREKCQRGALDVPAFYIRRILRIWPLYFAFVALAALAPALNPNHEFGLRYVIPFLLLSGNWSLVAFGFPGTSVAIPLWSVSVEEQFYLLWPPIVSRLSRRHILFAAVAMIAIANLTRTAAVLLHAHQPQVWCNTLARLDPIAVGIILAAILHGEIPRFHTALRVAMLLFGLFDLVLVTRYADLNSRIVPLPWASTLIGYPAVAFGCTLILLAVLGSRSRVTDSGALRYLGKISYGLYVYHELAVLLSDRMLTMPSSILRGGFRFFVALAITIVLAAYLTNFWKRLSSISSADSHTCPPAPSEERGTACGNGEKIRVQGCVDSGTAGVRNADDCGILKHGSECRIGLSLILFSIAGSRGSPGPVP